MPDAGNYIWQRHGLEWLSLVSGICLLSGMHGLCWDQFVGCYFPCNFKAMALREMAACIVVGSGNTAPAESLDSMHPILDACSQVCCLRPAWQQLWQGPMSHHAPSTSFGMGLLITACSLRPLQAHHRASHCIQISFPSPALNHHQANISACVPVPKECLIISLFLLSFLLAPFKSKIICTSLWPQRQYKTNVSTWK